MKDIVRSLEQWCGSSGSGCGSSISPPVSSKTNTNANTNKQQQQAAFVPRHIEVRGPEFELDTRTPGNPWSHPQGVPGQGQGRMADTGGSYAAGYDDNDNYSSGSNGSSSLTNSYTSSAYSKGGGHNSSNASVGSGSANSGNYSGKHTNNPKIAGYVQGGPLPRRQLQNYTKSLGYQPWDQDQSSNQPTPYNQYASSAGGQQGQDNRGMFPVTRLEQVPMEPAIVGT